MGFDINRYHRQFLVHSFLYYKLDETIIPDAQYDELCRKIVFLSSEYPEESASMPYYSYTEDIGDNGSGYYIQDYPLDIVDTALRILWYHRKQQGLKEDFVSFISRWGYTMEG